MSGPTPDAAWRPPSPLGGKTSGPAEPDPRCSHGDAPLQRRRFAEHNAVRKREKETHVAHSLDGVRRRLLAGAGAFAGTALWSARSRAATIDLPMVNGQRNLVAFPEKRPLIVLTSRPPQLETPFEVFNDGLITPNDAFFVRYHLTNSPPPIEQCAISGR